MVALYLILTTASVVFAQLDPADPTPLVSKHYAYPSEIVRKPARFRARSDSPLCLAIPDRQCPCPPRTSSRLQHLQLYHREPELHVPDCVCQRHRWCVVGVGSSIGRLTHQQDFCVWAPTTPNSTIGQTEAEVVAWCTKPGHGTRLIPDGALQGVQLLRTPDYIQIVGFIDQSLININNDDAGGEMDPHGADLVRSLLLDVHESSSWP